MKIFGKLIASQQMYYFVYAILFLYLFSIIFIDLSEFFNPQTEIKLCMWIIALWIVLMISKDEELNILSRAVGRFKILEAPKENNLYSFPRIVKYSDGETRYADGKIIIDGVAFNKFSYKNEIHHLSKADPPNQQYSHSSHEPPFIELGIDYPGGPRKGWGKDFLIGVFGWIILINYSPLPEPFISPLFVGCAGMGFAYLLGFFPFIRYGIGERVVNKIKVLPENKLDKNINKVLICLIRQRDNHTF